MAGRGSRLRPHSLTVPKPLIPVAGKPIVHRLVADIVGLLNEPIEEIAFILGDPAWFGEDVIESLKELASDLGAKASIYRQLNPLGTGHDIMCAEEFLSGPAVVDYADTLIRADIDLDKNVDSVIWTKKVSNPEAYGVVNLNENNEITELVEKPTEFVSDQAVIGIYYFKDVAILKKAGVPIRYGRIVTRAEGDDEIQRIYHAPVDADWNPDTPPALCTEVDPSLIHI